jgi:hypothetical protein
MKKKLYLHIGTNKAGSSAIQAFLAGNEAALQKLGYLYPKTGRVSNAHYRISGCLRIGVNPPLDGTVLSKRQIENRLFAEIEKSPCKNIIISSEYFILCRNPGKVKNFFRGSELRIIVYLRRHDEWFESLYNQGVKTSPVDPRWGDSIEAFITYITKKKHQEFNFWKLLQPWAKVFGQSNILVRPFEQEQFQGGNICLDFLDAIDIQESTSLEISPKPTNASLDQDTVFILDRIARMELSEQSRKQLFSWFLSHRLNHRTNPQPDAKQPLLSPEQRLKLIRRYELSYRKVAETYLERADGRLFFSDLPEPNEPWQPYAGPDAASSLDYANIIFDRLIDEIALLRDKVAKLEKVLEEHAADMND